MPRPVSAQTRNEEMMSDRAARQVSHARDPLEKLRLMCLARGVTGIIGIGRLFRIMDDDGSRKLNMDEFRKGVAEAGCDLTEQEIQSLFATFDADKTGSIDYDEFLRGLRPPMNKTRMHLVELAFNKMDLTGDGVITLDDLKGVYNCRSHPEYQNGARSESEIMRAWLGKFEHAGVQDGRLTKDEFMSYYASVSASIDEDIYFDLMMRQAWKL